MTLTLEQIATIAGVSRATVSRVINTDPNVSEKTRARVMRVIQEFNFQPNRAARSLAGGRAGVISLVIPVGVGTIFAEPFFSLLIQISLSLFSASIPPTAQASAQALSLGNTSEKRPVVAQ